jgi:pilus assembly protein CpaF
MRPDRLLVTELMGAEALDVVQAINTGYDGSMASLHATGPRDALARLEIMVSTGNPSIPLLGVREQIASAFNLILHQERLKDGRRRLVKITEVVGLQGGEFALQDIFEFRQTDWVGDRIAGQFAPTGRIPRFLDQLNDAGLDVPMALFAPVES